MVCWFQDWRLKGAYLEDSTLRRILVADLRNSCQEIESEGGETRNRRRKSTWPRELQVVIERRVPADKIPPLHYYKSYIFACRLIRDEFSLLATRIIRFRIVVD